MNLQAHICNHAFPMLAFFGVNETADFFASGSFWFLLFLSPLALGAFVIYKGFSAPLRRQEQARMVLDLIETGFRQGQRPENTLMQAAGTNDRALSPQFQQLAALLREGLRLSQALDNVPNLLPPQVAATLRVGEEVGDVRKVLPACRDLLRDANSQTRSAFNYLVISSMVLLLTMPVLTWILNVMVYPKFFEILYVYGESLPAVSLWVRRMSFWAAGAQLLIAFVLWGWVLFYMTGPRAYRLVRTDGSAASRRPVYKIPLWDFIGEPLSPWRDRILYALPWRRRRLQRDFCATLAILLDAETPEPAAISLAAEATANHVFIQPARRALADLAAGKTLPMALRRFDHAGEFSWRLANASAQLAGFLSSLSGWMESLDAKAFQQEQTASQLITTGLVLGNGLVVGLTAAGVFTILISLQQ